MRQKRRGLGAVLAAAAALALIGCVTGPVAAPSRITPGEERVATWADFDPELFAEVLFAVSNRVRWQHARPAFRANERLQQAASVQAFATAITGFPSHSNPLSGHADVLARVLAARLTPGRVGENVAATPLRWPDARADEASVPIDPIYPTYRQLAERVLEQWLQSPPHRAALLNPAFRDLACAAALSRGPMGQEMVFSVQVFYSPRS